MGRRRSNKRKARVGSGKGTSVQVGSGKCPRCGAKIAGPERYCLTCTQDLGAPNVRECAAQEERAALKRRSDAARKVAAQRKLLDQFKNFSQVMKTRSKVVVSMPAAVAKTLVFDPRQVYTNYETLVGAAARTPAPLEHDKHRKAVTGLVFGTYGEGIRYGILSLTQDGLPTYGDVSCSLRGLAIADRTTFLECNSFKFVQDHGMKPGQRVPAGYRSLWQTRHDLALAKLGTQLQQAQGIDEWQRLLVKAHPSDREGDDYIEAHIYGPFTIGAVEHMSAVRKKLSKEARLDVKLALARFEAIKNQKR